jgi:inner membrane protein
MTDISPTTDKPSAVSDFPIRKVGIVVLLLIATLLAGWQISGVVEEREARQAETLESFRASWGPEQMLRGPILVVPYQAYPTATTRDYFEITPQTLNAKTVLSPKERKRGLFHATVYDAAIALEGRFTVPSADILSEGVKLQWQEAFVVVSTETLSGMTAADHFTWNGTPVQWQNCRDVLSAVDCVFPSAMVARTPFSAPPAVGTQLPFGATLTLRGTSAFSQALQGVAVEATVEGAWGTPSFGGSMLPADSNVGDDTFSAHWKSADPTSPKVWKALHVMEKAPADQTVAKVELLEPTPTYRMINRASKYNILFVVLSFTTYFLFELLTKVRIHPLQYGLLGASLTLFALLLVSFAEMIGYDAGYAVSAGLVLLQASVYTAMVTRRLLQSLMFGAMLASLFGFLYVLLSLETYSLLVGSVGLFLVLSLVMALTQRVKWLAAPQPVAA